MEQLNRSALIMFSFQRARALFIPLNLQSYGYVIDFYCRHASLGVLYYCALKDSLHSEEVSYSSFYFISNPMVYLNISPFICVYSISTQAGHPLSHAHTGTHTLFTKPYSHQSCIARTLNKQQNVSSTFQLILAKDHPLMQEENVLLTFMVLRQYCLVVGHAWV